MKPVERRKLFLALHREAGRRAVTVVEDADAGSGSHGSLLFYGPPDVRPIRIVIVFSRFVSAGVQRGVLRYVEGRANNPGIAAPERALAEQVLAILTTCFGVR